MEHGVFDVYRAVLEDTNRIAERRQSLENPYIALITFVLAGDAYVAATSQFDNWLPVLTTVAIGGLGLAATVRYTRSVSDLTRILSNRYAWLRNLEESADMKDLGADLFTDEYNRIYQARERRKFALRELNLQRIFVYGFIAIPVLLAALTLTAGIPEVHQFIKPLLSAK